MINDNISISTDSDDNSDDDSDDNSDSSNNSVINVSPSRFQCRAHACPGPARAEGGRGGGLDHTIPYYY